MYLWWQVNDELYSVCSMRIIVDQWLMKDWGNADRSVMRLMVENHINSLNFIYKENVRYNGRLLRSSKCKIFVEITCQRRMYKLMDGWISGWGES